MTDGLLLKDRVRDIDYSAMDDSSKGADTGPRVQALQSARVVHLHASTVARGLRSALDRDARTEGSMATRRPEYDLDLRTYAPYP